MERLNEARDYVVHSITYIAVFKGPPGFVAKYLHKHQDQLVRYSLRVFVSI